MFSNTDEFDPRGYNPLNWVGTSDGVWTTVNTAETLIGVLTPLAWAFWEDGIEIGMRHTFHDFGILSASEIGGPPFDDERYTAVFAGRYAVSVNELRKIGDRMLGTSGDAVEEQFLGSNSSGIAPQSQPRRYPIVLAKMPRAALGIPKRLAAARVETSAWWTDITAPSVVTDLDGAADRFAEARTRFGDAMRLHGIATMLAQAAFDQVKLLVEKAGLDGLERSLVAGYGGFEEATVASDLWAVSRDRLTIDEFIARHGYHGPLEGRVDSQSWRQDPTPLLKLVDTYRTMDNSNDPSGSEAVRSNERVAAEAKLLEALSGPQRLAAKATLGFARRHVPLREVGKAMFLQVIDAGRAAAHSHAQWLLDGGHIDLIDDAFFLNAAEVEARRTDGLRQIVAARRAQHEAFSAFILPSAWTGTPELISLADRAEKEKTMVEESGIVEGLAVAAGDVSGSARVVLDPTGANGIEPGEILVCETTDPSWAPFFMVASALVIDIGGVMSHGAIIARELGVPCVINTGDGTRRIQTGDTIRVRGDDGLVEILKRNTSIDA